MAQHGAGRPATVWFVGDLSDPWVAAAADALASAHSPAWRVVPSDAPGDLPDGVAREAGRPDGLILHRPLLTRPDADRLARFRASCGDPPPRVWLCYGPHARYAEVVRWSPLYDEALPEATAGPSLAVRLDEAFGGHAGPTAGQGSRVAVVSTNPALRATLAEAVEALGYTPAAARDWRDAPPTGPAVWDVPLLEPGWPEALAGRADGGPVVALLGFADRTLVSQARSRGAAACLELPYDLADLAAALARVTVRTAARNEAAHATPPAPASLRRGPAAAPRVAAPADDA